ncbi:MAG: hypothetical protein Q7S74_03470 [Nanoarchaeota archaeon]|nr:hypothetical protein [Nanoarchaeota archaeon]
MSNNNPRGYTLNFDNLEFLAHRFTPPGSIYRFMAKIAIYSGRLKPEHSLTCKYEEALLRHKDELLDRQDTSPEVKTYIKKYIN